MSFSFTSIGHALASGLHDFYTGMKAVATFIEKADTPANQAIVEGLSSLIPTVGPEAVIVERGVFAVAGQAAAILSNISGNGVSALLNAGFDKDVISDFEALIKAVPGLVTGKTTTLPPVTTPSPITTPGAAATAVKLPSGVTSEVKTT